MMSMLLAKESRMLGAFLRVLERVEKREKDVRDVSWLRFFSCLRRS
jgi:hypothetical protein